ncbi:MAG TPA: hypothetical protein VJI15_00980 [Candidatus Nanoarchaeia archaeon]|nr:hypothetical protein [Candidatus Nanoarchaeia archaeon]
MADGSLEMDLFCLEETARLVHDLIKPDYVRSGLLDTLINSGVFTSSQQRALKEYTVYLVASYAEEKEDYGRPDIYDSIRQRMYDQVVVYLIKGMGDISKNEKLELIAMRD